MEMEEIVIKVARIEERLKNDDERLRKIENQQKQIQDLTLSVHDLAMSVSDMVQEQKEQSERLKKLEEEPANNWKDVKKTLLTTIISTITGAAITGIIVAIASQY